MNKMCYKDLLDRGVTGDEQVSVWYRDNWCGRLRKGVLPTRDQVIDLVSEHNNYYVCAVANSFDTNRGLQYKVTVL